MLARASEPPAASEDFDYGGFPRFAPSWPAGPASLVHGCAAEHGRFVGLSRHYHWRLAAEERHGSGTYSSVVDERTTVELIFHIALRSGLNFRRAPDCFRTGHGSSCDSTCTERLFIWAQFALCVGHGQGISVLQHGRRLMSFADSGARCIFSILLSLSKPD